MQLTCWWYISSENTVRDDEIDGRLMAILYRDYFDSVKIPAEINLTPAFCISQDNDSFKQLS